MIPRVTRERSVEASRDDVDPVVATDGAGNAMALLSKWDDGNAKWIIVARRYVANVGWSAGETVGDAGTSPQPDVAMDYTGNAIAVWRMNDGTQWNVWASEFN